MPETAEDFEVYLPTASSEMRGDTGKRALQKFTAQLRPGQREYRLEHNFGTQDVVVQTRIAGVVREGGIRIVDENTVLIVFGGPLHEAMDVVIIG